MPAHVGVGLWQFLRGRLGGLVLSEPQGLHALTPVRGGWPQGGFSPAGCRV